jgi:hypothetical protein
MVATLLLILFVSGISLGWMLRGARKLGPHAAAGDAEFCDDSAMEAGGTMASSFHHAMMEHREGHKSLPRP